MDLARSLRVELRGGRYDDNEAYEYISTCVVDWATEVE